jgi:hypothetical protein
MATATVGEVAKAHASLHLVSTARALTGDAAAEAAALYKAGLDAELGKWPNWVSLAERVNITVADLNYPNDPAAEEAFGATLDQITDMVVPSVWTKQAFKNLKSQRDEAKSRGDQDSFMASDKAMKIISSRRSELRGMLLFGGIVGRRVLDKLNQQGTGHKASVWTSVFSVCRKHCEEQRSKGNVIDADMLRSLAATIVDPEDREEKSQDQKMAEAAASFANAVVKGMKVGTISNAEYQAINRAMSGNPHIQQALDRVASKSATAPEAPTPTPAPAPTAKPAKPAKPAPAPKAAKPAKPAPTPKATKSAGNSPSDGKAKADAAAKVVADVI